MELERSAFDVLRVTSEETGEDRTLVAALQEDGSLGWRESELEEAVEHLSRKRWIVPMLLDGRRNAAYDAAIVGACAAAKEKFGEGAVALEVGAGTGLLTALLCRGGLAHVVACEMEPAMARLAEAHLAAAGAGPAARTVVTARSDAISLPAPAAVVVSEIVDHGLLGEGLLPSLREVYAAGNAAPGAIVVPRAAAVYAAVVECGALRARRGPAARGGGGVDWYRAPSCDGGARATPVSLRRLRGYTMLTPWTRCLDVGLDAGALPGRGWHAAATASAVASARGTADAVVYYWTLDLGFGQSVSNAPGYAQDHWLQMAQPLPRRADVRLVAGDSVDFAAHHDDERVVFDLAVRRRADPRPPAVLAGARALCACGWHLWTSADRLASLPGVADLAALAAAVLAAAPAPGGGRRSTVLDVSDTGTCALACALAGADATALLADPRDRRLHHVVAAAAADSTAGSFATAGGDQGPRPDLVCGEPYYHDSEGQPIFAALRFHRRARAAAARPPRGPDAPPTAVWPPRATVVLRAIRSEDLARFYCSLPAAIPLEKGAGVPHAAAARAWEIARRTTLIPLDLDDYDATSLGEAGLHVFDFSAADATPCVSEATLTLPRGRVDALALSVRYDDGRRLCRDRRCLARLKALNLTEATNTIHLTFALRRDGSCALDVRVGESRKRDRSDDSGGVKPS